MIRVRSVLGCFSKVTFDFSHSTIGFSVRHMMISKIYGVFESYTTEIALSDIEQMEDAKISFTIAVARKTLIVMCILYSGHLSKNFIYVYIY
ncbi:YceI family protein [Lysinibacillus sp. NPDC059133]|uniref:YceI family protein n=1 Tax=Lysinibacillus sp. NPDC059133 TaxID=3346737 RepID=UPI00369CACC1